METVDLSRRDNRSRTELASRDEPEMEDLGEEYLMPAVLRLIESNPRVQRAILDIVMSCPNIRTETKRVPTAGRSCCRPFRNPWTMAWNE